MKASERALLVVGTVGVATAAGGLGGGGSGGCKPITTVLADAAESWGKKEDIDLEELGGESTLYFERATRAVFQSVPVRSEIRAPITESEAAGFLLRCD